MSSLLELAVRCEAATGPDRQTECDIFTALNPEWLPHKTDLGTFVNDKSLRDTPYLSRNTKLAPRYTASLDAALTLVPVGVAWCLYSDSSIEYGPEPEAGCMLNGYGLDAATPALALCAAALRARASQNGEQEKK